MKSYILRVEGGNFDATIDDTNDLSTRRGASLSLLRFHSVVEPALRSLGFDWKLVFNGASQCAYSFDADADKARQTRDDIAAALGRSGAEGEPFSHLTFVVDVANDDDQKGVARAEARNHARQFRQWTLPPKTFTDRAKDADPLENVRPGTVETHLPRGKVLRLEEGPQDPGPHSIEYLSESVASRRSFGRRQRHRFYRDELGEKRARGVLGESVGGLSFISVFEGVVADPPELLPLYLN